MSLKHRVFIVALAIAPVTVPTWAAPQAAGSSGGGVTLAEGTWAAGFDVGFVNPIGDDDLDLEPIGDGYIEYFFTPNFSIRGMLGIYNFDGPDNPGNSPGDLGLVVGTCNVAYYWSEGKVHPFVTGGVGFYDYNQDFGDDGVEFGFNGGGGATFDIAGNFAIKVEGAFHGTTAEGLDSFFTATAGGRWLW